MSARDRIRTSSRVYGPVGPSDEETLRRIRDVEFPRVDRAAKRAELRERFSPFLPEDDLDDDSDEYEFPHIDPAPPPRPVPPPLELPREWRALGGSIVHDLTGWAGIGGAEKRDQFSLFNSVSDTAIPGCEFGTTRPRQQPFTAADVGTFRHLHPARLRNLSLFANNPHALESGELHMIRQTPMSEDREVMFLGNWMLADRYQTTRLQIPINNELLDGFTFLRFIFPRFVNALQVAVVAVFDR